MEEAIIRNKMSHVICSISDTDEILDYAKMYTRLYLETGNTVFADVADEFLLVLTEKELEEIESLSR